MDKVEAFDKLLEIFDGTPAEATLREMYDEFLQESGSQTTAAARSFDLIHLVIHRMDTLAEMWKEVTDQ